MPEFLSPEWLAALDARARSSKSLADIGDLTLQMVVRHGPGGEMTYHIAVAGDAARVHPGPAEAPDLTLVADYDVASAISRGTANVQEALAGGRFKITGKLEILRGKERTLAALDDVFAEVRAATTYPDPPTMRP